MVTFSFGFFGVTESTLAVAVDKHREGALERLSAANNQTGPSCVEFELTNHTGVSIAGKRSTLGRHAEIDDLTARKFWLQFDEVLGEGWWR